MTFLVIPWWFGDPSSAAESFYDRGTLAHSIAAQDLMKNQSKMIKIVSHFQWDYQNLRLHEPERNTFTVITLDEREITFDRLTGLIISESGYKNFKIFGFAALAVIAGAIYGLRA